MERCVAPLPKPFRRRRRGLTLIEAAVVLGVITMIFAGTAVVLSEASESQRARVVADRLKTIMTAAEAYMNARIHEIRKMPPGTRDYIAVQGSGHRPGFPGLIEGGYLPSAFRDYTDYNQTHVVLFRVLPPQAGSTLNQVEALVTTAQLGGSRFPLRIRGRIARLVGPQGGYCTDGAPDSDGCSTILGVGGSWRANAADWQFAGVIAERSVQARISMGDEAVVTDFLNRNDIGDPAANTMNTTIVSKTPGEYAMAADPSSGQTVLKFGPNVTVPGNMKVGACGDTPNQAGDVVACRNVSASRFRDRDNPSYGLDPAGKSHVRKLNITDTVVKTSDSGDRLDGNDTIRLKDLLPRYVAQDGFIVRSLLNETGVPVPQCAGGGLPRIFLSPRQDSFSFDLNNSIKTTPSSAPGATGGGYDDYLVSTNGATPSRRADVDVDCGTGSCTTTSEGFLADRHVGTRRALNGLAIDQANIYRQLTADPPSSWGPGSYWTVRLDGSPFARQADGAVVPWEALATTYCFY